MIVVAQNMGLRRCGRRHGPATTPSRRPASPVLTHHGDALDRESSSKVMRTFSDVGSSRIRKLCRRHVSCQEAKERMEG